MATPALDCLRQNYPKAKIIGVIRRYAAGVVRDGLWFDQIIDVNDKTAGGFFDLVKKIRRLKPDAAVLLPNSIRSSLALRLGGVKRVYGYRRGGRSLLLSGGPKPVRTNGKILPIPMVEYYMDICRYLGLRIPETIKPRLFISNSIQQKGKQLLDHYGIESDEMVIGINPGAKFGSSKCWPPEYFARLAELFTSYLDCRILLFAGPGEERIARSITDACNASIINTYYDKIDLALLKYLIRRCSLLVTNDTGPRHYAVAFDVPAVVLMGPTDPRYTAANLEKTSVLRMKLECSPCHKSICPGDHECMVMIKPETVFQESKKIIKT